MHRLPVRGANGLLDVPAAARAFDSSLPAIVLMLDGDEAGQAAKQEIVNRLMYSHWIRAVSLAQGIQPDQLSIEELRLALDFA